MALIEVAIWEERDGVICFTPVTNSGEPVGHLVSGDADHPRAMRAIIEHYEREPQTEAIPNFPRPGGRKGSRRAKV